MPETGGRKDPAATCPRCSSEEIERIKPPARDEGARLTADITPPAADPPNMVCDNCGHTWWVPDASSTRR